MTVRAPLRPTCYLHRRFSKRQQEWSGSLFFFLAVVLSLWNLPRFFSFLNPVPFWPRQPLVRDQNQSPTVLCQPPAFKITTPPPRAITTTIVYTHTRWLAIQQREPKRSNGYRRRWKGLVALVGWTSGLMEEELVLWVFKKDQENPRDQPNGSLLHY